MVGGRFYLSERETRRDRKRIYELDVHNLDQFRISPLAELIGKRAADKHIPSGLERRLGREAGVPHGLLRGRRWAAGRC